MMNQPPIQVSLEEWAIIRNVLNKHVPTYTVWAFGSRAKGYAKKYSDLDLAIIGEEPLGISLISALTEAFSESNLPWKVDIIDWANTSDSFRKIIEQDKVVIQ